MPQDDRNLATYRSRRDFRRTPEPSSASSRSSPASMDRGEPDAHFVRPELVGEFGFTEWTGDGKLRHPRFLGLRMDKSPEDVHRERPRA